MKRILLLLLFSTGIAVSCTTVIISGKATRDGRPLIWKNRDTGRIDNKLAYCTGEKYNFAGVFDLADTAETDCFMGSNDAGLCVINTASYNLRYKKFAGKMDQEGVFIRRALSTCATLEEFEALLNATSGTRGVEANFGVIDAKGGAAYYETDPYAYVKYDVNDPHTAPHGYLVRTNFSFSGTVDEGQGYIRYRTAEDLFYWGRLNGAFSVDFILNRVARSMTHSLTRTDLAEGALSEDAGDVMMVPFADYIPRFITASSLIMQGIKAGEDPRLTTLWLVPGNPLMTPVIPVWTAMKKDQPSIILASGRQPSPVNAAWRTVHARCFPLKSPEGERYLDLSIVLNRRHTGSLQRVTEFDRTTLEAGSSLLERLRKDGFDRDAVEEFYRGLTRRIETFYR
ncbi:MAG: carcinine hydrolase/isopenicillin-N N-acyltransferase family protein [Acidobacteriota bacterium]